MRQNKMFIRGSIVVSISACHAEDPGSIPGRGGVSTAPLTIKQIQLSALGMQWQVPGLSTIMLRLRQYPVYLCPYHRKYICLSRKKKGAWFIPSRGGSQRPWCAFDVLQLPATARQQAPALPIKGHEPSRKSCLDKPMLQKFMRIRGSIVVSISACHAEDPGSIPGRGGVSTAPHYH